MINPKFILAVACVLAATGLGLCGCGGNAVPDRPTEPVAPKEPAAPAATTPSAALPATPESTPAAPAPPKGLVPLRLTPAGIYLTMYVPPGTQVKGAGIAFLEGQNEFDLAIRRLDEREIPFAMDSIRTQAKEEDVEIVLDTPDAVIIGLPPIFMGDDRRYQCCVRLKVGGSSYACSQNKIPSRASKEMMVQMVKCAQTARQTAEDLQAEVRANAAWDRLIEASGRYQSDRHKSEVQLVAGVTDEDLALLKDLPYLSMAYISAENLTANGLKQLSHLPNLESVELLGAAANDSWLAALPADQFKRLYLLDSSIGEKGLQTLQQQSKLEKLTIRRQTVSAPGLAAIAALPNLKELTLTECKISDEALRELSAAQQVESLELQGNPLTDQGLPHLAAIKTLSVLRLGATSVTQTGAEAFKKMRPNVDLTLD